MLVQVETALARDGQGPGQVRLAAFSRAVFSSSPVACCIRSPKRSRRTVRDVLFELVVS